MYPLHASVEHDLAIATEPVVDKLIAERVAARLADQDPTLWGPEAAAEAAKRLGWTKLHATSRDLIGEVAVLRAELASDGVDRVVLAGMGGSSLAPEVITRTEGVALTVLDTTDPGQVADALAGDLHRTVLVVSSKSGGTVETDSQRRAFVKAFTDAGIDAASRIVVVTDPGSPLESSAKEAGYRRVFAADPNVGGRYSALTAFGLVPSGLAGIDVAELLDDAADAAAMLAEDIPDNPALLLACALGAAHARGAEKVVLAAASTKNGASGILGFADWVEQLVAESTGKHGTGLLPVIAESPDAAGFADAGTDATPMAVGGAPARAKISTGGPLGGQFLLWEYATAIAGKLLGINPFDQPDVEAAKQAARALLDAPGTGTPQEPRFVNGAIEVYPGARGVPEGAGGDWLPAGVTTVDSALEALVAATPEFGYLAMQAYLDRLADASAAVLRPELARRTGV
ncbi:MAG: glucose-6-phosphate isomerase, partial [Pseudonocardiaceae bacterium]